MKRPLYLQVEALRTVDYLQVEDLSEVDSEVSVEGAAVGSGDFFVVVEDLYEERALCHVLPARHFSPEETQQEESVFHHRRYYWKLKVILESIGKTAVETMWTVESQSLSYLLVMCKGLLGQGYSDSEI